VLELRQFLTDRDTVAVLGFARCRARSTGKIYETDFIHLVTFQDRKITRFQEFFDTYAAAEAFRVN
jgi:ketosteroid isomerase-like protein